MDGDADRNPDCERRGDTAHIAIGSASGARGTQVSVAITLTQNGPNIVTIAPLVFTFDPTVLTFSSCASDVAGEQLDRGVADQPATSAW